MRTFLVRLMKASGPLWGWLTRPLRLPALGEAAARRLALGALAGYGLVGMLWVLFSDRLLYFTIEDPLLLVRLQTLKGWIFVIASGGLVSLLVWRSAAALVRSQAVLREREAHLRDLLEGVRAIVWECDADSWEFTYISQGVEEILGYPVEQWYADANLWANTIHPEDRAWVIDACMAGMKACRDSTLEYRAVARDGRVVWLRDIIHVVTGEAGKPARLRGIMVDITEQKHAEEQILRNERRLEAAQRIANIGDWEWEIETDAVTWSDELFRIFGLEPQSRAITLESYLERIHPDDRTLVRATIEAALVTREPFVFEHRLLRPDGTVRYLHVRGEVILGPNGTPGRMFGTANDITERKRTEDALRRSEERFRTVFENAPIGIMLIGPEGDGVQGNPALERIFGMNPQAAFNALDRITHPDDFAEDAKLFGEVVGGERDSYQLEKRYIVDDGRIIWGDLTVTLVRDASGEPSSIFAMVEDITERKGAEQAVAESEARFRALVENITEAITILDADGTVRYASPAFERITGYTPEERAGRRAFERVHPEDVETTRREWRRLLATPGATVMVEPRIQHKDGQWRTVELVGKSLLEDPVIRGVVVTYKDVTVRKSLEAQLRQAQKMEAVGRLAGGVAHDFNNVLTAILGHVQLAMDGVPDDHAALESLDEIQRNTERAATLTRQLLAFSRQQVVRPEVLDLNEVVTRMQAMLGRLIGADVAVETSLAPDLARIEADPGQIEQVLMNLVVNARDAMPDGGRITIATRNAVLTEEHAASFGYPVDPGPHVLLSVADTGMGMGRETQARIFEPFFTTKAQGKGTGLGLSTVYGIVKQASGCIRVSSASGEGTTFEVYLPRAGEGTAVFGTTTRRAADRAALDRAVAPAAVLVVEDEAPIRALVRKVLGREGYTVLEAGDGNDAVRVIREQGGAIDLILTDVVMPGMGGHELVEVVRRTRPEAKVLVMSGYAEDEVVRRGIAQSEVPFLEKPFTPVQLVEKVRAAIGSG